MKNEPQYFKFWGRHACALSALVVFCANGFGFKPLYEASAVGLLVALIFQPTSLRLLWTKAALYLLVAVLLFPFPQIAQSTGAIALLLIAGGNPTFAFAILFAALPAQLPFGIPNTLLHPITTALLGIVGFTATSKFNQRHRRNSTAAMALAYGIMTVMSVITTPVLSIPEKQPNEWSTRVGDVLTRIIGTPLSRNGILLHESPSVQEIVSSKTIIAEHDTKLPEEIHIKTGNDYLQPRPWRWNQPLGNETLRFAISNDGFLITNRGTKLHGSSKALVSLVIENSVQTILLEKEERLIVADSDMFLNFLAPYQPSLCGILGNPMAPERLMGIATGISLIVASALLWLGISCLACWNLSYLLIFSMIGMIQYPRKGDVRWVGDNPTWPHHTSGYGLVAAMQKQGLNYIFGTRHCKVLSVGENRHAKSRGEALIFLEPGASVTLQDGKTIECGKRPLGMVDEILDARDLFRVDPVRGDPLGSKIVQGNIMVIGTGSPARQGQFKQWIERMGK